MIEQLQELMSGYLYYAGLAVAAFIVLGLFKGKIARLLGGLDSIVGSKLNLLNRLVEKYLRIKYFSMDAWKDRLDKKYINSKDALLRGDLEAHAKIKYPQDKYPTLWIEQPDDLARSCISDGRVIDGTLPAKAYGARFITNETVAKSRLNAISTAILWGCVVFFVGMFVMHDGVVPTSDKVLSEVAQSYYVYKDVFTSEAFDKLSQAAMDKSQSTIGIAENIAAARYFIEDTIFALLIACLAAFVAFQTSLRFFIAKEAQAHTAILSNKNKEATVRYKYRSEQREMDLTAFNKQLSLLKDFDKTKTLTFGKGTGTFKYRGVLPSYREGQAVKMSLMDMMQHLFILGGSGEGKTRTVLKPLISQILNLRKQGERIAIYATDAKAVLWKDVKAEADKTGDTVFVVGCEKDQYGVDLLDGTPPALVADILKSTMKQLAGGKGSDEFWVDMASEVIRNAAVVAEAWERTPQGIAKMEEDGERLYSIANIYRLSTNDKMAMEACTNISETIKNDYPVIADLDGLGLWDSLNYLVVDWQDMAAATKSGVSANITNALSGFVSNTVIREKFGSGAGDLRLNMATCLHPKSITCIALSSMEHGTAARVVNVFLKSLLYREARREESANPNVGKERLCAFIADEFQELATADMSGYSDASFWNVARSTGVFGIVATQSLAAIEQAIGKEASENLMLNFRSKLFLRVEDPRSIEYMQKIFGKTLRSYTFEDRFSESFDASLKEKGLADDPACWDEIKNLRSRICLNPFRVFFSVNEINFIDERSAHSVQAMQVGGIDAASTNVGLRQSARFREEDLNQKFMSEGNHEADVIRNEDITQMGRSMAVAYIQRAGAARMDIITID